MIAAATLADASSPFRNLQMIPRFIDPRTIPKRYV